MRDRVEVDFFWLAAALLLSVWIVVAAWNAHEHRAYRLRCAEDAASAIYGADNTGPYFVCPRYR